MDNYEGLPKDFRATNGAIQYQSGEDDNGQPIWKHLCEGMRILAVTRTPQGEGHGRLFEITDSDGNQHLMALPIAMITGGNAALLAQLCDYGMTYTTSKASIMTDLIMRWRPAAKVRCVTKLGWTSEGCTAYVLGSGKVLGDIGGENVVFQSEAHHDLMQGAMRTKGDLAGWSGTVEKMAKGNPILQLAICTALSGPLLQIHGISIKGGGINFIGPSSRGKTTALLGAVSVIGSPQYLQSWNATANGLEARAVLANSGLLALDELGESDGNTAGKAAYMLANGVGRGRAQATGSAKKTQEWCLSILSSSEIPLADKVREDHRGGGPKAGQMVRLLDIAATDRAHGVFDDLHGYADGAAFSVAFTAACAENYGSALPAMVKAILAQRGRGPESVTAAQERLTVCAEETHGKLDPQVHRAAHRLAVIAAAGAIAAKEGIVPWSAQSSLDAAALALHSWINQRGGAGSFERDEAVKAVRDFLGSYGASRFIRIDDKGAVEPYQNIPQRAGWVKLDGSENPERFHFADGALENQVLHGRNFENAIAALEELGFLITQGGRHQYPFPRGAGLEKGKRGYCISASVMGASDE